MDCRNIKCDSPSFYFFSIVASVVFASSAVEAADVSAAACVVDVSSASLIETVLVIDNTT